MKSDDVTEAYLQAPLRQLVEHGVGRAVGGLADVAAERGGRRDCAGRENRRF